MRASVFNAALCTTAKAWSHLNFFQKQRNGQRRCGTYIQWTVTQPLKKEQNNTICSNMDGPRDYYTKWYKSDRERQVSYDITYMWNIIKTIQVNLLTKQTDLKIKLDCLILKHGEDMAGSAELGDWD